jgi:hypothetical protein
VVGAIDGFKKIRIVDSFPLVTRKRRSALGVVVVAVGVIGVTTSAVLDEI